MKPKFSICVIAKNEEKVIGRLLDSLKEFMAAGGDVNVLDTGSTDKTVSIAKSYGCRVKEADDTFMYLVPDGNKINNKFLVEGEQPIVKITDKYFNFSEARNYCAALADSDIIFWYDADEAATVMDIDKINALIDQGYTQFEYWFVFAHDQFGNDAVRFIQCKSYNRKILHWTGIVHELVTPLGFEEPKRMFIDESVYKLSHYQNHETGRHTYLTGLAVDAFLNPKKDRQSHYFARELFWSGRLKSAQKEFNRHIQMNGWLAEQAESFLFLAEICGALNDPRAQARYYSEAFYVDSGRNTAHIRLAHFYRHNKNYLAAISFAKAALEIPYNGFYADNIANYREVPHEILYQCYGWIGNIEAAKQHLTKALQFQPYHKDYLRDTKFYFEYPDNGIEGWMRFDELQWLYNEAKKHESIVEVGSWKGKSTHALANGTKGLVWAVDTWEGSEDPRDDTNWMAKNENVFDIFKKNTEGLKNLKAIRKSSIRAASDFDDGFFDMIFIDAGHTKEDVLSDIEAWFPKVKQGGIICGHDYQLSWMGVIDAVKERFGKPDGTCDSIWWVKKENQHTMHIQTTIPKTIYTCWFSEDGSMPEEIKKCIKSQLDTGYSHQIIGERDVVGAGKFDYKYVVECFNSAHKNKKWVKLTDYVRMQFLYKYGGIFLDADVEILPGKNFDHLLNEKMFVGLESANWDAGMVVLGTAVIGAQAGHPLIKKWIDEVEANFRGDDDKCYESSMHILNKLGVDFQDQMRLLEPEVFYPYNHFNGETKVTENTIAIHHFNKSWVEESLTVKLTKKIISGENFVLVKRGDGEMACMRGLAGSNCDGHPYSPQLALELRESYNYLKDKAIIVEFDDQKNYNSILHRTDSNLSEISSFYKSIAESPKRKILIAPAKLSGMAKILNAEHYEIPEKNFFEEYEHFLFSHSFLDDSIYLFCAGMPAKLLIADLHPTFSNSTFIDCGSAFDPIVSKTRTFQISKEQFLSLYKIDNFSIPQESHPEKLYTIQNIGEAKVIYDLGCGSHKTFERAIGMDIRPVTDITGSIDGLPFDTGSAHAIISRHSLEHVLDPAKALKEWVRVLKRGGKMVVVLPDHGAINTIDPYYSNGEHLHAYTRESFGNFISLFPDLHIIKSETVLPDWSFGAVIYKLPSISIVIPHLQREYGLQKCIASIDKLNYPKHLIETIIVGGPASVPNKLKEGVFKSKNDFICYAANDMTFDPDCLVNAISASIENNKSLVSFNEGQLLPDGGNCCTHFIIRKSFIDDIGGDIFSTDFNHVACDNYLWAQCEKLNQAHYCESAKITHNHFSKGSEFDSVYKRGWENVEQDRRTLIKKIEELNGI